MPSPRRRTLLVVGYFGVAIAVVASVAYWGSSGTSTPWFWEAVGVAGLTYAFLSYRSAEVNDRLLASSSVMVLFSVGIILGIRAQVADSRMGATVAMTVVAMSGFLSRGDLSGRKVLRPLLNLGQLALTGATAGLVIDVLLSDPVLSEVARVVPDVTSIGTRPGSLDPGVLLAVLTACIVGASLSTLVNSMGVRTAVRILYGPRTVLPWSGTLSIVSAQVAQSVVGGMLGIVLVAASSIALVPFILTVYVIGNMVFTSHATLRATHEAMLRGFVKILETRDLYTRGHTERVAEFSLAIGRELGFSEGQLARMRFAALIHDVGKLAVPTAIMRKQGALNDEEYREMRVSTHKVDDLLSEVDFLAPMVVICSGVHPKLTDEDFGQTGHVHSREATREQSVLAVADAFDAMTSTRSYRMAMSQSVAVQRLGASNDPLFHPEVVAALGSALSRMSGSYGPPEISHNLGAPPGEVLHA